MRRILKTAAYALADALVSVGGEGHADDGGRIWAMALLLSAHLSNILAVLRLASPSTVPLVIRYRGAVVMGIGAIGVIYALIVGKLMAEAKREYEDNELAILDLRRRWRLPTFAYLVLSWAGLVLSLLIPGRG